MNGISGSPAAALAARGVNFSTEIGAAAARYRLDPLLLAAVAAQETGGPGSNGGRNIVGDGGHGRGVFQIDDRFHGFARTAQAMNPAANANYAAGMISDLLHRYGGDVHKALSAYNAGNPEARGTVTQWQDGTRLGYADSVLRHYAMLGGARAPASQAPAIPDSGSLLDALSAESPSEQADVSALSSFASLQMPSQPQPSGHSYRELAGLDDQRRAKNAEALGSIVDPDDADDDASSFNL